MQDLAAARPDAVGRRRLRALRFEAAPTGGAGRDRAAPALVDRLIAMPEGSVVSIVAPAGYGKSTLLAQWAERSAGRLAWLSLDERDNDPETLLAYIAAALDRVEPVDPEIFRRRSPGSLSIAPTAVLRLARAMSSMQPITLVLDQGEALHNPECRDVVAELAVNLPAGAKLAIASREDAAGSAARLRSRGAIAELGVADLALDAGASPRAAPARGRGARRRGDRIADRAHRGLAGRVVPRRAHAERGRHRSDRRPRVLG